MRFCRRKSVSIAVLRMIEHGKRAALARSRRPEKRAGGPEATLGPAKEPMTPRFRASTAAWLARLCGCGGDTETCSRRGFALPGVPCEAVARRHRTASALGKEFEDELVVCNAATASVAGRPEGQCHVRVDATNSGRLHQKRDLAGKKCLFSSAGACVAAATAASDCKGRCRIEAPCGPWLATVGRCPDVMTW